MGARCDRAKKDRQPCCFKFSVLMNLTWKGSAEPSTLLVRQLSLASLTSGQKEKDSPLLSKLAVQLAIWTS